MSYERLIYMIQVKVGYMYIDFNWATFSQPPLTKCKSQIRDSLN